MKPQKGVSILLLSLLLVALIHTFTPSLHIHEAKAHPGTIYADNFDDQTAQHAPVSMDWSCSAGSGGRDWWTYQTEMGYNQTSCYMEVTNSVSESAPNSLMANDTSATLEAGLYVYTRELEYSDATVEFAFRKDSNAVDYPWVRFYQYDYSGAHIANPQVTLFRFYSDGNIQYYTGAWTNVTAYAANAWHNITLAFNAVDIDFYVNGSKTDVPYWHKLNFDRFDILMTGTAQQQTVYVDNLQVSGTYATEQFYEETAKHHIVRADHYVTYLDKLTSGDGRGSIHHVYVKTSYGSWYNLDTSNTHVATPFSETHNGATQIYMPQLAPSYSVTNTSSYVALTASAADSYINYTNDFYFPKTTRYFYWRVYRKYNATKTNCNQRQVDFLPRHVDCVKLIYTNATGTYSQATTPMTQGTVRKDKGMYHYGSPTDRFGFWAYYLRQNLTYGSIFTYAYEDTDSYPIGIVGSYEMASTTLYQEFELTFGVTDFTDNKGGLSTITDQTIEECAGVITFYEGDETSTDDMLTLSQSLYSDWSDERTHLAYLVDADDGLYQTSTGTIKSAAYTSDELTTTINASTGQTSKTQVYYGTIGTPTYILNQVYDLDDYAATSICVCTLNHSSAEEITISWDSVEGIYIQSTTANITEAPTFSGNMFTLTMTGTGTTTTEIYIPTAKGRPHKVFIDNNEYNEPHYWTYDGSTQLVTVTWTHASPAVVKLKWRGGAAGRYNLHVYVTQGGYPASAILNVQGINYTAYALHNFELPRGTYDVTCYCGDQVKTKRVGLYGDTSIGFSFEVDYRNPWLWGVPLLFILVAACFLFIRKR